MSSVAVTQVARLSIDHCKEEGNELADRHDLSQRFVESAAQLLRMDVVSDYALFQSTQTRRQQCTRYSLAGDIGD